MPRLAKIVFGCATLALMALIVRPHFAGAQQGQNSNSDCSFTSAPSIAFGNYDVYGPAISSTATINGFCANGTASLQPVITLGKGNSTTYRPRKMDCISGACATGFSSDYISYNLYTNASLATIWGNPSVDASTGSVQLPNGCCKTNSSWSATVYGQIPAAVAGGVNDAAVGNYTDTVVVTVTF